MAFIVKMVIAIALVAFVLFGIAGILLSYIHLNDTPKEEDEGM